MNSRQRLLNTLEGKKTDRVPIYTLIPFDMDGNKMVPGPFLGYPDIDDWRKKDPNYVDLVDRMQYGCDNIFPFKAGCIDEQNLFINPDSLVVEEKSEKENEVRVRYRHRNITKTETYHKGSGHKWITEHFCKSIGDALELAEEEYIPVDCNLTVELKKISQLGNLGIPWCTIPSPIMSVCRLFDPRDFLLFSATDRAEILKLMDVAYERTRDRLERILAFDEIPLIRFGGAEHATPPLMSPFDFDELVYEYDKPLMDLCHRYNKLVAVHCHGNIRHAVRRFREMGVDQLDPVEALPWGDISLEEIRGITKDSITLTGNIQFCEINESTPERIRERVREIISTAGPDRLIISTTGTPPEKITDIQFENYNAMIDETLSYKI